MDELIAQFLCLETDLDMYSLTEKDIDKRLKKALIKVEELKQHLIQISQGLKENLKEAHMKQDLDDTYNFNQSNPDCITEDMWLNPK